MSLVDRHRALVQDLGAGALPAVTVKLEHGVDLGVGVDAVRQARDYTKRGGLTHPVLVVFATTGPFGLDPALPKVGKFEGTVVVRVDAALGSAALAAGLADYEQWRDR